MQTRAQVVDRLRQCLRLKGRDWKTLDSYGRTAAHYYDFAVAYRRLHPAATSEQTAEAFLTQRVTRDHVSASTEKIKVSPRKFEMICAWALGK